MRFATPAVTTLLFLLASAPGFAQPPGPPPTPGGAGVFQRTCASCHVNPAADSRAPNPATLATFAPDAIVNALTNGSMRIQGEKLTEAERREVAEFVTGRAVGSSSDASTGQCASAAAMSNPNSGPSWNGWGAGVANARFQPANKGGLTAADVPKLKLKWAFGFPGVLAARAQPAVAGGRLFVASENGTVYALDAKTGCSYWTFRAQAAARSAMTVGPYKSRVGRDPKRCLLRRQQGERLRHRCRNGTADLGAQDRRSSRRGGDRLAGVVRGAAVRAGGGHRRRRPGRTARLRVLHVPRQPVVARCEHRRRGVEDLQHCGRAEAARQDQRGRADVRAGRRRHLGGADRRFQARRGVYRDRQRLRRSAAADDRCGDRDRSENRQDQVGESDAARRRLDDGMPAAESGQPEMSRDPGSGLRLLGVTSPRPRARRGAS